MFLESVTPGCADWAAFVSHSYQYLAESWPAAVSGLSREAFCEGYAASLALRLSEGGRGLFLVKNQNSVVGLANVFLTGDGPKFLNVAEFYIVPTVRRSGTGTALVELLEQWGRNHGATWLRAEVDRDQGVAKRFWSSIEGVISSHEGERLIYIRPIRSVRG